VASVLVADLNLALWFEEAVASYPANPLGVANLVANDLLRELAASGQADGTAPGSLATCQLRPAGLAELVKMTDAGTLSKQQAREVLAEMFRTGQAAATIVAARGLAQNNDTAELEQVVREVVADPAFAKSLTEYRAGNAKAINALKGPIMKRTQGKANPAVIDEILRRILE
jgi:aspartyl-tRNA(Asn)/glutamyl-tRNA(Gln) amidotransferase subunit B